MLGQRGRSSYYLVEGTIQATVSAALVQDPLLQLPNAWLIRLPFVRLQLLVLPLQRAHRGLITEGGKAFNLTHPVIVLGV